MGRGPRYRVMFRRRRQKRTDFRMRKAMILSKNHRLVIRGSLKHIQIQIADALPSGDKILASANSRDLAYYGWKAPTGNIPAAYLTGYLLGKKAVTAGLDKTILDIGLANITNGSKLFAALKGAADAGLNIPCDEGVLPSTNRIMGEHIGQYAKELQGTDPAAFQLRFSQYLSKDLRPEELPKHLAQVKERIDETVKEGKQ